MTYDEEGQLRLRRQRSKQAIALAMQSRWKEAIAANREIIDTFPNDVEAYNRLGRAYMQLGMYSQAREAYGHAVELDPYNNIAKKNLQRLSHLGEAVVSPEEDSDKAEPHHFIEEVGKAGIVELCSLAPHHVIARMAAGDTVYLRIAGSSLSVGNNRGEYVGQVDPRHGQRLIRLIGGGNKYAAAIVSSAEDKVTVIIREVYQDPNQAGQLSFPPKGPRTFRPYVSDRMFREGIEDEEALSEEPLETEEDEDINN